jgi:hypothetical protein
MQPRFSPKVSGQIGSTSADYTIALVTPWVLAAGTGNNGGRVFDELRGRTGGRRQKIAWQTAQVLTDFPANTWNFSQNIHSTEDAWAEDFTPTAGHLWVRAGLGVSTSASPGDGQSSLQLMTLGRSEIVADQTLEIEPYLNSAQTAEYALGRPFPALGATKLIFGIVSYGVGGTITVRPMFRAFQRLEIPGSWSLLGTQTQDFTTNAIWSSGELAITPGVNMWGETGLAVSAEGRGRLRLIVAAIW